MTVSAWARPAALYDRIRVTRTLLRGARRRAVMVHVSRMWSVGAVAPHKVRGAVHGGDVVDASWRR